MKRILLAVTALISLASCSGVQPGSSLPASPSGPKTQSIISPPVLPANIRRACAVVVKAGEAQCEALERTDVGDAVPGHVKGDARFVSGYGPADLHSAYNIPSSGGTGQTVGIVDAFGDPKAEHDLAFYRKQFDLPPCTSANGCFQKLNQRGIAGKYPSPDTNWASEVSIDLDMVSATCPSCKIILVEADDNSIVNLGASVSTAVAKGANVVSNSYSGFEYSSGDPNYEHPGHVIVASSDDSGLTPEQPCTFKSVVCVGGTSLLKGGGGQRGWREVGWLYAGSGCSETVAKPSWQHDKGCDYRTESDVSAVADPITGIAMYDSYGQCCWFVYGGTSVASPIIASLYALAGNEASQHGARNIWDDKGAHLFDITEGHSNGPCVVKLKYVCKPGPGYDGPTGWGTPNGLAAF